MPLKPREVIDINDPRVSKIGHPAPPWLVNYADLMTELVCFFIILYSLSAALSKNIRNAKSQLDEMMKAENIKGQVTVTKEGLSLTLEEQEGAAYFEVGKSELTENAKKVIDKVIPILVKIPNDIVVEGHTDNIPIHNISFDSNWELSTARSTNVVKYMVEVKGFPAKRLSATGYGEFKPITDNSTPEGRSRNRRVVFFIKK